MNDGKPHLQVKSLPIPKVEDLFATLKGGKTKLDVDSRKFVVINTHKGLPYGIFSAPGIFQRAMESLLLGSQCTITGETESEHLRSLEEVLKRLSKAGLRVKKCKCQFTVPSVSYLGHMIDAQGLHPLPEKIQAVLEAPIPTNVTELKSYLGLLTYYGKFLPNLGT